ncbi:aspartate aminotransferase family protein [Flavobacterium sp. CYK-4]|uniref:pyridoxal phosphate-dependent decarboxylase family protein n=1 Tax=Flavobacterium lotistagni TaxID=2709660 RepID=UPI001408BD4D|nr:pyridoxal-dependent decarboxylase [Flavobacterium lotistagni]NHM07592.1 aspartate aminotransferase family protein [Flavobacterium lotistagni]
MNPKIKEEALKMDRLLESIKIQAIDYLNNIASRPTSAETNFKIETSLSQQGLGASETLTEFNKRFEPVMVASSGPRFWGLAVGGTTPAAIMGDWLATIYDQISYSVGGHGDNSALIELETIELFMDLLNLPKNYWGGFVTGATMSNFTSLAVARQWVGKKLSQDIAKNGITEKITVLASAPHSSIFKSLSLIGLGSNNITIIKTEQGNRESIDLVALESEIQNLKGQPFILISSAGTVNTVDFDDLETIAKLKDKYDFWWHIDAAFGGFAACSDQYKHLLNGWENADSITVDCHKWLNVPYESAVFFIKEEHKLLQVESFQNSNAPYLGNPNEELNFMNLLPENSRRLKALPSWFSLKAYGKEGYKEIVENNIRIAHQLGEFIASNPYLKLLAPVRLNTVCFSLANENDTQSFLYLLNNTRQVYMTPTVYKGEKGIRAAIVNWRTSDKDVEMVMNLMQNIFRENPDLCQVIDL